MNETLGRLGQCGVIPVVVIDDAACAEQLGRTLLCGGLACAEITFRTAAAESAIRAIAAALPDMLIGAGTVLSVSQAEAAAAAGAKFIISPGFDPQVVDWCLTHGVPTVPGVMTPTEINMGLRKGLTLFKFFPAEAAGGVKALQAIGGPYSEVKFIPTGGVGPANMTDYLRLPIVHACAGNWIASRELIANRDFDRITALAVEAAAIVKRVRNGSPS